MVSELSTSNVIVFPNEVKSGLFLNIVVGESTAVFQLLSGEDQSLLIGRDAFLVLDLGLHVVDGVGALHLQGDGLAGQSFHEDLHLFEREKDLRERNLRDFEIIERYLDERVMVVEVIYIGDETDPMT
nr:hypothetical protein CFP56_19131 [Quercus suber]